MTQTSRVTFHHVYPPYYPGDVAGIPQALAQALEARGIVTLDRPRIDFAAMDREALAAFAREHLGVTDPVPEDVTDEDLRGALRDAAAGRSTVLVGPTWDQLDALDRAHLEAFAKTKCKMGEIDAALSDDELRAQIRAVAAATLNGTGAETGTGKTGKKKPQ